jgi:hypothetical protein
VKAESHRGERQRDKKLARPSSSARLGNNFKVESLMLASMVFLESEPEFKVTVLTITVGGFAWALL